MEQIYYTQCPVGYGLGTSNGFQIKRLDPAYPMLGDFRHLTLRAFLPARAARPRDRSLSNCRRRRRRSRVFDSANSRVSHRARGLWGRPGGQFAHGLRLNANEMSRLRHWPAGLIGQSFWRRDDPGPTLGAPPAPIELPPPVASEFETAARLAAGRDVAFCARLLTALASAARDGRTLVVIDRPEQLGDLIALLTLAFPEVLRTALTFSTYHDRPEELTGYRLQGAVPDPRRSRQTLDTRIRRRHERRDDRPAGRRDTLGGTSRVVARRGRARRPRRLGIDRPSARVIQGACRWVRSGRTRSWISSSNCPPRSRRNRSNPHATMTGDDSPRFWNGPDRSPGRPIGSRRAGLHGGRMPRPIRQIRRPRGRR